MATSPRFKTNPALKRATCAALIAATFAVPVSAEAITSIERYCTTSWRQAGIPLHDWEDCTQDTMLELLSRLPQQQLSVAIDQPSSTARRELMRSVWCVSQRWRRAAQKNPVSLDAMGFDQSERQPDEQPFDTEVLNSAVEKLSETQRNILSRYCEGSSIAEIADELDLPAARVSDQKYKAIRELKKLVGPSADLVA